MVFVRVRVLDEAVSWKMQRILEGSKLDIISRFVRALILKVVFDWILELRFDRREHMNHLCCWRWDLYLLVEAVFPHRLFDSLSMDRFAT